jgi:UDP:flavonoid glycosyltransferase YjiC (YdhE family)
LRAPPVVAPPLRLACFVTPHGFGHAARACAVLDALGRRLPLRVELFTTVPEWFFRDSLAVPFTYHPVFTDVGLAQRDALTEDLAATVGALDELLPFASGLLGSLAATVRGSGCAAVLCDIAPLGIAVAQSAGLPAALVENFTWDWIYAAYEADAPALVAHGEALAGWFDRAALRLQAIPACRPLAGAVTVAPIARRTRQDVREVRAALGLRPDERAVLVTMGGIAWDFGRLAPRLPPGVVLLVPGGAERGEHRVPGAVLMPFRSRFHHPDLVAASAAVVGKVGYSTFAEAWSAGVPYGFIPRQRFPESPILAEFVTRHDAGMPVPADAVSGGHWEWLDALLAMPRREVVSDRGDEQAAAVLEAWLASVPSGRESSRPRPGR